MRIFGPHQGCLFRIFLDFTRPGIYQELAFRCQSLIQASYYGRLAETIISIYRFLYTEKYTDTTATLTNGETTSIEPFGIFLHYDTFYNLASLCFCCVFTWLTVEAAQNLFTF